MSNEKLPKILAVLALDDHGPCDGGATAVCPHCGAQGRYVYTFLCDDGTTRGAMRGCIKLFPKSEAADECEKALAAERAGKNHSGARLRLLEAIEQLRAGTITIQQLEVAARDVKAQHRAWMLKKGYARR